MVKQTKESKLCEIARKRFKRAIDSESDNRERAEECIRFARLGEQWPDEIKRDRAQEGRPCLTINKIPAFIRQIVNDSRMNKPAIKCHPVDSNADPKVAEILNGVIKNIEVTSNADIAYDTAIDFSVTCGFGYLRVGVDFAYNDTFDLDIVVNRIVNPFSVYTDPDATEGDGSDWKWCFVTDYITRDEFEKRYPDVEMTDWDMGDDVESEWLTEDKVRIAEYWTCEEVVKPLHKLNDGSIVSDEEYLQNAEMYQSAGIEIVETKDSKSKKVTQYWLGGLSDEPLEVNEWKGHYIPIIPVYGDEVWVDGKVHYLSAFYHAMDSQRQFNYWRTATTELVALAPKAPFIGKTGAFDSDINKWNTANVKSHPFIEYDGEIPPQRQPFAGTPAGALQEALNASDDMKSIIGIHDASLGARSNETSGRAIMARQREGDVSTFHFIDNMNRAIRQTGRVLVDLIPKVYSEARILRIIGEDDKPKNVKINQEFEENGITKMYDLTVGRYDVTVSTGGNFTTQREEALQVMTQLVQSQPAIAPIIGDVIVKLMDFPDADKVSKRLNTMLPQNIRDMENQEGEIDEESALQMVTQAKQELEQIKGQMQQGMQAYQELIKENEKLISEKEKITIENNRVKAEASINDKINQLELIIAKNKIDMEGKEVKEPKTKVQVQAPSGQMYEAVIGEEEEKPAPKEISISAPSGNVYKAVIMDNDEEETDGD